MIVKTMAELLTEEHIHTCFIEGTLNFLQSNRCCCWFFNFIFFMVISKLSKNVLWNSLFPLAGLSVELNHGLFKPVQLRKLPMQAAKTAIW